MIIINSTIEKVLSSFDEKIESAKQGRSKQDKNSIEWHKLNSKYWELVANKNEYLCRIIQEEVERREHKK